MTSAFFSRSAARTVTLALLAATPLPALAQQGGPPPAVTVSKPVKKTIVDYDEYVGRFAAIDSVNLNAQVSGYLDSIHFTDGQMVKAGDLLFTIDQRTFKNVVDQAQANLEQAQANLDFAVTDLERGRALVRDKTVSAQTFDQRVQTEKAARASVAAQEANLRSAQLNLGFTEIRSPVSGRIGDRRVSVGNLVTGGTTGGSNTLLATVVSTDPIYFNFTFDEAAFIRYQRLGVSAKDDAGNNKGATVQLRLIDETSFTHEGNFNFTDNAISDTTGTIRGRAVFENSKALFTPGMFGRIQVPAGPPHEALLVPDAAIGTEQIRKFVFVVGPENKVSMKYVTLGRLEGGLRVIRDGLSADDVVVVNGTARIRAGAVVTPQQADAAPAAQGAAPAKTN